MEKLTKENIYIDLRGKSKEELTDLYWLLKSNNEDILNDKLDVFLRSYFNSNMINFNYYQGFWSCANQESINKKQEVTIQQLKEILQPMGTFKKGDTIIITDFGDAIRDGVFSLNRPYKLIKDITEGLKVEKDNDGFENGYSVETTLTMKIELYSETLQQQLQKAEAEVKRLQSLIEDSKPKNGDICVMDNGNFKFITIFNNHESLIDSLKIKKIQDQELINKLNDLIK